MNQSEGQSVVWSTQAVIDDPDVREIRIEYVLHPGKNGKGLSSLFQQRALLKYVASITSWAEYCLENGMKVF